jgi:hypothetical protein
MVAARQALAEAKGASALQPWNMGWALAGDTEKAMDPYFPFEARIQAEVVFIGVRSARILLSSMW